MILILFFSQRLFCSQTGPLVKDGCGTDLIIREVEAELDYLGLLDDPIEALRIRRHLQVEKGDHRQWSYRQVFFRSAFEEALSMGIDNTHDLKQFLTLFRSFDPTRKKIFIENVIKRIDYLVEKIAFSKAELKPVAKKLEVNEVELLDFTQKWAKFRNTNSQDSTLAIVEEILDNNSNDYIDNIIRTGAKRGLGQRYKMDFITEAKDSSIDNIRSLAKNTSSLDIDDPLPAGVILVEVDKAKKGVGIRQKMQVGHFKNFGEGKILIEESIIPKILENIDESTLPIEIQLNAKGKKITLIHMNKKQGYADIRIGNRSYRVKSDDWIVKFDEKGGVKKRYSGHFITESKPRGNEWTKGEKIVVVDDGKKYTVVITEDPLKAQVLDMKTGHIQMEIKDYDILMNLKNNDLKIELSDDGDRLIFNYINTSGDPTIKHFGIKDGILKSSIESKGGFLRDVPGLVVAAIESSVDQKMTKAIEIYDRNTGRLIHKINRKEAGLLKQVQPINRKNQMILVYDNKIVIWDYKRNRPVMSIKNPPTLKFKSLQYSDDGKYLFMNNSKGRSFAFFKVESKEAKYFKGDINYNFDEKMMTYYDIETGLSLIDKSSGKTAHHFPGAKSAILKDDDLLIISNGNIDIYDYKTMKIKDKMPADIANATNLRLKDKYGDSVLLESKNGHYLLNLRTKETIIFDSIEFENLVLPNDGKDFFIIYNKDETAYEVYRKSDGVKISRHGANREDKVEILLEKEEETLFKFGSSESYIFDVKTSTVKRRPNDYIVNWVVDPEKEYIFTTTKYSTTWSMQTKDWHQLYLLNSEGPTGGKTVKINNGRKVLTEYFAGAINFYDLKSGKLLKTLYEYSFYIETDIKYTLDGRAFVAIGPGGTFSIYDAKTFKVIASADYKKIKKYESLGFSPPYVEIHQNQIVYRDGGSFKTVGTSYQWRKE